MSDAEKAKRKAKPHRRSRLFIGTGILLIASLLVVFTLLVFMWSGVFGNCPGEFEILSTQIAATNDAVATLLSQTQIASTPSP